jgi:hypothetical protein
VSEFQNRKLKERNNTRRKKKGRKEGEREKEKTIKKKGSEFINAVKKDFLTILAFPLLAQSFQ